MLPMWVYNNNIEFVNIQYFDLIACILVVKKNNELLMKNCQAYHTSTKPILEGNDVSHYRDDNYENECGYVHNCGCGRGGSLSRLRS